MNPDGLLCPACKKIPLEETSDLGVDFLGCADCKGLFTRESGLESYVAAKHSTPVGQAFLELLSIGVAEDTPGTSIRSCPRCDVGLERLAFGESPVVAIDRCVEHGLWMDRRDLKRILRASRAHAAVLGTIDAFDDDDDDDDDDDPRDPEPEVVDPSLIMQCPNCRSRFEASETRCEDCNVQLFEAGPP